MTKTQRLLQLAVWYLRCNLIIAALAIFDWWPFQSEMFDMKPIIVLSSELPCNILITFKLKLMLSLDPSQLPAPKIYLSNLNFKCTISLNYKVSRHCLNAWSLPRPPSLDNYNSYLMDALPRLTPPHSHNWFKMKDLNALNFFYFERLHVRAFIPKNYLDCSKSPSPFLMILECWESSPELSLLIDLDGATSFLWHFKNHQTDVHDPNIQIPPLFIVRVEVKQTFC